MTERFGGGQAGPPEHAAGRLIRPFLSDGRVPAGSDRPVDRPADRPADRPTTPSSIAETSVRPFLVTSGRTTAARNIGVETQVMSTAQGETAVETLTFEYRDIVALCAEPLAVAEIAARLSLHLGVTRVLVTDLQQQGLVTTHVPQVDPTDDVDIIIRVINALRQRS